ncbi:MAG: hypothetical protein JXB14_02920 [Candidatus Altiarchaeota archaeon]|nr:hypothetical protein [Candidatus Altiarchaeota archaeon]
MDLIRNRRGQESALSGDLPAIIMIVVSIGFFISSLAYSIVIFDQGKSDLLLKRAAVESATIFMKESARIDPDELSSSSSFWQQRITGMQQNYGVNIYVELVSEDITGISTQCELPNPCPDPRDPDKCRYGKNAPPTSSLVIVKSFPISVRETDLCVFPGIIRVKIWR